MNVDEEPARPSPYLIGIPPSSPGRVLLARGFEHYCTIHWGFSGGEIAAAFDDSGEAYVRDCVIGAAALLGSLFARGVVRGWSRPFGGGEPTSLRETAWELDDFSRRFALSALDPTRPFDQTAAPTHWIFVDLDDWNAVVKASVTDVLPHHRISTKIKNALLDTGENTAAPASFYEERFIRAPEVERRTGLSRSTIYRRVEAGQFPRGLSLSGNITAWRESEVADWIAQRS